MADRNEKVFERVRQELAKSSKLGSRELYQMAKNWDQSIGQDTLQQFHARYVLPIKREESSRSKKRGGRRAGVTGRRGRVEVAAPKTPVVRQRDGRGSGTEPEPPADRDKVRTVLLEFARDFADAESRADIMQVVSRIDDYVDKIAPRS
ncbi:MAG: hypothetical protein GEU90_05355 [Gemmatimonas sp.]|nr:hypothetical protein [Gemmatimonas sp.]